MAAFWWWTIWLSLVVLGAALILRYKAHGALATLLILYAFLQASSHFFWVPWYQDGGNGVGLGDWFIWLLWAGVMTALASIPTLVATLTRRAS